MRASLPVAVVAALSLVGVIVCALTRTPIPDVLSWTATGSLGGLLGVSLPATGANRP